MWYKSPNRKFSCPEGLRFHKRKKGGKEIYSSKVFLRIEEGCEGTGSYEVQRARGIARRYRDKKEPLRGGKRERCIVDLDRERKEGRKNEPVIQKGKERRRR